MTRSATTQDVSAGPRPGRAGVASHAPGATGVRAISRTGLPVPFWLDLVEGEIDRAFQDVADPFGLRFKLIALR